MKKALSILLVIGMILSMAVATFANEVTNEARIGETEYATLADAVAAANADTTTEGAIKIELIANTTFTSALTINRDITISGAYTITRATDYTGSFATVNKDATLTLDGGLVIDGNNNWSFDSENFYADMEAGKTLKTGALNSYTTSNGANATAALIKINAGGTAVMNTATIQNCWADNRNNGALFSVPANATLITNEGSVINHIHASVAGQVSGTWTMNGGKINDVYGHSSNGGLVDIRNSGVVTINGGEISNVRTLGLNANGNGIIAQVYGESAKLYMNGGYIHDNASFAPGGGWGAVVYLNRGGDFFMTGGIIKITESNKCSAFVANTATTIELLGGTMVVEPSTAASFDSLIYGDVTIGEDMEIICDLDSILPILGDTKYTAVINGEINGTGLLWILYNQPITGEGTVTTDVLIKADPSYFGHDGKVTLDGANWLDSIITVNSIGSDASLTVTPNAYIDGVQIRVLDSVESGDYTNADEAAAAQAAAYMQQEGATVKSPVLFFHRLTSAQKSNIVVTFDYNGGLDAQNWSGCQLTSAEAFAPACPTPTKEGYVFAGWAYAENNEPETLSMATTGAYNGEEIAQSLRLVAQWSKIPCDVTIEGETYFNGDLTGGYEVIISGGEYTETVISDEEGKFSFSDISFNEEGTYVFEVVQTAGEDTTVAYDATVYTVTVTVAEGENGQLEATVAIAVGEEVVDAIAFENYESAEINPNPNPGAPTPDELPQTGDPITAAIIAALASLMGIGILPKRKEEK